MAVAARPFAGFTPDAIQFLTDLAQNNDRAWFQPRKADYERLLKEPLEAVCVALGEQLAARGIPLEADPKHSPFRIHRDIRFSRDKSPYKTHLGASFPWVEDPGEAGGPVDAGAHANGGYFHFEPGEMYAGGGMWMAEKPRWTPCGGRSWSRRIACARPSRSRRSSPGSEASTRTIP